jgi:hypothetical protein
MNSWREDIRNYVVGAVSAQLIETSPQAEQPSSIKTALRPHQLSLLEAARALEAKATMKHVDLGEPQLLTRYGVIGDRVGAGKSLVALSLVRDAPVEQAQLTLKEGGVARLIGLRRMPAVQEWNSNWGDLSGVDLYKQMFPVAGARFHSKVALFIVPHNVTQQWEAYIRDQTNLKAYMVKKTRDCDYERDGFYRDVFTADLVVVSCTMLRKFTGALSFYGQGSCFTSIVWSRLFIDEADSITLTLRPGDVLSRFTWFITGSWLNMLFPHGIYSHTLQGLPEDLRLMIGDGSINGVVNRNNVVAQSISDSRDPRFTAMVLRNSDAWIDLSLLRPTIVHDSVLCKAPANLGVLRDFISPAAMEALHAGDTAGALAALGLKASSKETLVDRVTESLRGDLVQAQKILAFKRDIEYSTAAAKVVAIQKAEEKVVRIQEQLASLESRVASAASVLCPICYDTPNTATLTPCCRQSFCLACICECIAAKPACPLCRLPIASPRSLMVIGESTESTGSAADKEAVGPPTKGAALLKLLSESTEDQRFLVFSAHEASFKGLRELLSARGIRCEVLQGSSNRVERLRSQFQDGTVRVLCMNARHVGAGINLEAATHVVLYHRMNVELEKQVIGRAVRFERSAELRVVHLVHEEETAYNGVHSSEIIMHC